MGGWGKGWGTGDKPFINNHSSKILYIYLQIGYVPQRKRAVRSFDRLYHPWGLIPREVTFELRVKE